jgi:hypothetical protein
MIVTAPPANSTPMFSPSPRHALLRNLAFGYVTAAAALAGMIVLADRPLWWRGLLAASVISAGAAIASLPPLMWGLRQKLDRLVAACFMAAGIRAVISLGGALFAVFFGRYPAAPTLLMMVCYYFVLLAIETSIVARRTWQPEG